MIALSSEVSAMEVFETMCSVGTGSVAVINHENQLEAVITGIAPLGGCSGHSALGSILHSSIIANTLSLLVV